MVPLGLLIRPTIFTVGVCGSCFCGAAIYQYESRRKPFPVLQDWISTQRRQASIPSRKYLEIRQQVNKWKNQLTTGDKIAGTAIFINLLVFGAWRINRLRPLMNKFFMSHTSGSKIALSPMMLSCFSHSTPLHFAFNMYALYSFSNYATALLGPEQLVALFLSAGAVSSLTSIAFRLATNRAFPSLGASGAILGVVAYICIARPDSQLLVFFVPVLAGNAIKTLLAIDTVGMVFRWSFLDHAAHLGGSLFGIWYATYGEKLFYANRRFIVENWLKIKGKLD